MHGHQLRLLAEEEHVHLWTDVTVGALYGAIKRLAADGLIAEVRVEREGAYPQRQVWEISPAGLDSLAVLRMHGLTDVVVPHDPFDLAMTRLDPGLLDDLPARISSRLAALRSMLDDSEVRFTRAYPYLTVSERVVMQHKAARLRAEIDWHDHLLTQLPDIIADETARTKAPQ